MYVFGTETHMTAIVGMALRKREIPKEVGFDSNAAANMFFNAQNKVKISSLLLVWSPPSLPYGIRWGYVNSVVINCFYKIFL